MAFDDELKFEIKLINLLFEKGWEREVIRYPTEEDGDADVFLDQFHAVNPILRL